MAVRESVERYDDDIAEPLLAALVEHLGGRVKYPFHLATNLREPNLSVCYGIDSSDPTYVILATFRRDRSCQLGDQIDLALEEAEAHFSPKATPRCPETPDMFVEA